MDNVAIYQRKTTKYRDGWSGNDQWDYLTTLKLTPAKCIRVAADYDDGGAYVSYARIPIRVNKMNLLQSVEQTMSGSNCRHEHDCCGCITRYTEARMIKPRIMKITTNISYNY